MISVHQLARMAYEAYANAHLARHGGNGQIYPWACLPGHEKAAWCASVQAVRAQIATVQ